MNYKQSKKILQHVKKANKILVNCHHVPDLDSVSSCISLYMVITQMGKKVTMVNPDKYPPGSDFLPHIKEIRKVDYSNFNFSDYDLFIIPDAGTWKLALGYVPTEKLNTHIITIDHHYDSESVGFINLIDNQSASATELLFGMYEDWDINVDKALATVLLTGIIGDTGAFQFNNVKPRTLRVAGELLEKGADKDKIIYNVFRSYDVEMLWYWSDVLRNIKVDEKNKFAYSAVNYKTYSKYNSKNLSKANSYAASLFLRAINGTDFGMTIVQNQKDIVSISLRERYGFDVSKIAHALGGGGHKSSSAAEIHGVSFEEAVKRVLRVSRRYAKQFSEK